MIYNNTTTITNNNNNNNNNTNAFVHSVVIPIDPKVIMNSSVSSPNMESVKLHGNQPPVSPPRDHHNNNVHNNNSNGNGNINKGKLSNLEESSNTKTNGNCQVIDNNSFLNSSDYSQSPFNPLLSMTQNDNTHNNNENEELSLASNQFKLFVQETLKKVSNNNRSDSLNARLIIPSAQGNSRWGLKISGASADLVEAARKEIMRSPAMMMYENSDDEEVDMDRTSKSIESLLSEEDEEGEEGVVTKEESVTTPHICGYQVNSSLCSLILGPKHHVIKSALANYNCSINWDNSMAFLPTSSSVNLRVSGLDQNAVVSTIQLLKDRNDRVNELPLAMNTLVIDSGKLDWIYSSGAIKQVEETLWKYGASLTQLNESVYQVTCLSGALLSCCLKRIHEILSRHQSAQFTFRFRNDFRDFTTKCSQVFESLAQLTDCSVSQKCSGNCVEVEIGGSSRDLARALIRLETINRAQIFESGSSDLKLVERRMRLYAPAEIREFICGKKDGKLNRIIKETGVNIELNMIGGDSMNVDLIAEDPMGVNFCSNVLLHALRLIEGEFPAELTFHVPEVHHKRMIGHGGKVIQRIMKKWGVYVKFMNGHETQQCHQISDPIDETPAAKFVDNVVVKTPSKNASALKAIKEEIFEECSVSELTGTFDPEAFKYLKKIQSSSKSRVSVSLPLQHRSSLCSLLKMESNVQVSFYESANEDTIILEGEKEEISEMITMMASELKNEIAYNGEDGEIIVKSPLRSSRSSNYVSSPSLSDESFKFFPSALFVVQSQQSISAAGSPVLFPSTDCASVSPASSIAMNSLSASLNSSPPMPVGHQKKFGMSSSSNGINSISDSNFALAETRRRSADIF